MDKIYIGLAIFTIIGSFAGTTYLKGRSDGRMFEAQKNAAETRKLNDVISRFESEIEQSELQRLSQVRELQDEIKNLEEQADEDPDAGRIAIPARSVQRINSVN